MPQSVLIVDDEPRITAALMTRLEASGYTVYHAINGLAGIEAAALYEPDAIILDIRLPDIDGYETCQRLRRFPTLQATPVIFLTANVQDEAIERAKGAGGSRFITKPYEACDILRAIEELTSLRNAA
ncbi:MAG: response regulator [Phycisphaerales bacterium]|nr:response regulator [Phycisphaerales bacterium]